MRHSFVAFLVGLLAVPAALQAQAEPPARPIKKLVEYGWDVPYPDQVRKDIRNMEKKPFDGVIFRLRDWNHAFDPRLWDETQLKPQLDDLAAIEWKTFSDNFLCLYAANHWKMDWFDDEQWKHIAANLRLSAKAAKIGRCVGIVFDPEPYGENPWAYPGLNPDRSFAEVEAQVRKRGAEFMTALQTELPNVRLLTFFHQSLFDGLLDDADPQERQKKLSQQPWGLLSAFWNGALEAAGADVRIIDGNEVSYYFTNSDQFSNSRRTIKERSLSLVPPELRAKHATIVQAGMALYMDQELDLREPREQYLSHYLTPAEQLRFFEHNVYCALMNSDEYVWCYSERLNWWEDQIPAGAEAAIRSARTLVAEDRTEEAEQLRAEVADSIARGQKKMAEKK